MDKSQNNNGRPTIPPQRGIFDVVRPGRTPASPTSRPVVNNQRPVQDTSVTVGASVAPRNLADPRQAAPAAPLPGSNPVPSPPKPAASMPYGVFGPASTAAVPAPAISATPPAAARQPMQAQQDVGEAAVVGEVTRPDGVPAPYLHEHSPHEPHHPAILSEILAIVAIVFLIAIIVNILVDAEVLDLPIPHTNFFDY